MNKQDISVDELVKMIQRNELQLPEIQRQYVWRAPRVRDLLDSLYRGYPSGTILVWQTDQPVPTRPLAIEQGQTPFEGQKLLLDGQQRLTSLAAVMSGEKVRVRGRKNPVDILFNLEHPEGPPKETTEIETDDQSTDEDTPEELEEDEAISFGAVQDHLRTRTFVVSSRALASQPRWVSVTRVFSGTEDTEILEEAGIESIKDSRYRKYTARLSRLRQIKNYMYVMHVLPRELSYEEVTEIFVRVNSLGMKLRSSDLALAQITSRWRTFLSLIDEFQVECEHSSFTMDTGLLVRTMIVFATRQALFRRAGSTPVEELKIGWEKAKQGLRFAVNFLRTNAGIEDQSLLSASILMIPIAVLFELRNGTLTGDDEASLLYWFNVANARGRYTRGSTETLLNEDLGILFRGGKPSDLLEPITRLFGRLHVEPIDLTGRPARSTLFPLAYLALKARNAKDWETGLALALANVGKQHLIQYHHIFPKAVLREAGYEPGEINEIANLAFLGARANQRIGKKPPEVYFPEVISRRGEEALSSQVVPLNPKLWRVEHYREFLEARRILLAEAINEYMVSEP